MKSSFQTLNAMETAHRRAPLGGHLNAVEESVQMMSTEHCPGILMNIDTAYEQGCTEQKLVNTNQRTQVDDAQSCG